MSSRFDFDIEGALARSKKLFKALRRMRDATELARYSDELIENERAVRSIEQRLDDIVNERIRMRDREEAANATKGTSAWLAEARTHAARDLRIARRCARRDRLQECAA